MKNLVLGGEGFVGKPLVQHLLSKGEDVVSIDIKNNHNEDLRDYKLDLSDVDKVFFLAWDVGGAKYLYKRDSQFTQLDWNLRLMINTMPQLQNSNAKFLFASSQLAEEYDTVYGATKRLGEVWTHLLGGARVRFWNVYGPLEEPSERTHVVSDFIYQAVTTGKIKMLTTGAEKRQFIHIEDLCHAICSVLDNSYFDEVYDITSFEWITIRDIAEMIAEMTNAEVIPGKIVGSTPITPIKGKVPLWYPRITLYDGLKKMISEMNI